MKVDSVAVSGFQMRGTPHQSVQPAPGVSFQHLYDGIRNDTAFAGINRLLKQVVAGKQFSPTDLLRAQLQVSLYNQRVELISKAAESGIVTVRKLQGSPS